MLKKTLPIIWILIIVFPVVSSMHGWVEDVVAIGVGDSAPGFTLVDAISSDSISLADYRGKVVLVDFFATWCGPCRLAIDNDLVPLWNDYYRDDPSIIFLSVDIWDSGITAAELQAFTIDHSMTWSVLMGSDTDIDLDYAVEGVPTVVIIDRNGIIKHYHLGSPGATQLKDEIDTLLSPVTSDLDLNDDGVIDILDVSIVAKAFGARPGHSRWNATADIDDNGVINIVDVAIIGKACSPRAERLLRIGFAWPLYADPAVGSDECSTTAFCNLYDPLVFPVAGAAPKPWVAQNWTVTPDGLNYTFNLKSGIKFHSGRELTTADVEFSLKRLLTIGQGYSFLFAPYVKSVQARSTYQVELVLNKAFGPFITVLMRLYIVDKQEVLAHLKYGAVHRYTIDGTDYGDLGMEWLALHDAGSGAYRIVDAKMDQWFKFALVPNYWGEVNPNAPTTVIQQWTSGLPATEKTMMLNRELEVTDSWLSTETLDSLDADPHIAKVSWPDMSEYYFMFNCMKPPLDDVHVRKALAYCFDYRTMITEMYSGHKLATSCVPESVPGYLETQKYYYNVTKAEEELKLSKYYPDIVQNPDNYPIEFHWIAEVPERERDALLFAENALALKLKVNVVMTPWLMVVEEMTNANLSAHVYNILVSSSYPEAGSLIQSRYRTGPLSWESNEKLYNSTLDAMIDDALSTTDSAQRFAKYAQIQRDIMEICPSLFIYDYRNTVAIQDYVKIPAADTPTAAIGMAGYDKVYKDWQVLLS